MSEAQAYDLRLRMVIYRALFPQCDGVRRRLRPASIHLLICSGCYLVITVRHVLGDVDYYVAAFCFCMFRMPGYHVLWR